MKKNIFRWLSIFFLAVVCVGFASCGDDDEDVVPYIKPTNSSETDEQSNGQSDEQTDETACDGCSFR